MRKEVASAYEDNLEMNKMIAEVVADKLMEAGIHEETNQPQIYLTFRNPQDKWEADLALNSLDMALALNELSMQASYHKHEQDGAEYAFWNRFSEEVNRVLEDHNIFELVITRMI